MHEVERPVEATLPVHVLAIFAFEDHMDIADVVALHLEKRSNLNLRHQPFCRQCNQLADLLALGRVESGESHDLHHLDLFRRLPLELLLGDVGVGGRHVALFFLLLHDLLALLVPRLLLAPRAARPRARAGA